MSFSRWLARTWNRPISRQQKPRPQFRPSVESLEHRCVPSITLDPISNVSVPGGKTLFVPLTSTSSAPVTYSVSSSNPQVTATLHNGDTFVTFTLSDPGVPAIDGQTITLQLYSENAPNNVARFIQMVNSGFYNNQSFYRIVPGFIIQGGNQVGTGVNNPDEYTSSSIFANPGVLAFANSGDNTNQSEIFITTTTSNTAQQLQQRDLDFNFTVLGQVVRGQSVVDAISNQPASGQSATPPIIITSAQVVNDTADNSLTVFAPLGQSATITVTANNGVDAPVQQTFTATPVTDIYNDPPFLVRPLPTPTTTTGKPVTFTLPAIDLENDPMTFEAILQGTSANNATVSVNGNQVTVTPNAGFTGTLSLLVGVEQTGATSRGNDNVLFDTALMSVDVTTPPPTPAPLFAAGAGAGGGPQVNVYNATTGALVASFYAFSPSFTGGVRVAVADINGDGTDDIICAAGPGGGPQVIVIDGTKLTQLQSNNEIAGSALLASFDAFAPTFTGGVFVAAGATINGQAAIALGAGPGGGPQVVIFTGPALLGSGGSPPTPLLSFEAFARSFSGGVSVALSDMNADGIPELIVGAGPGGGPQVAIYDGRTLLNQAASGQNFASALLTTFYGLAANFTGGLFVTAGLNSTGQSEVVVGQAPGSGGAAVNVYSGSALLSAPGITPAALSSFNAFGNFTGGVYLGFSEAFGSAGTPDFLTGAGPGANPQVTAFDATSFQVTSSFFALTQSFTGGVFIAG